MCLVDEQSEEEASDLGMVEVSLDEILGLGELQSPLKGRLIGLKNN